jgi:hypothetical protein
MTSDKKAPNTAKKPTSRRKTADKAQFERFVEAAREIGMDEDPGALDRAFRKVAPSRPPKPQ